MVHGSGGFLGPDLSDYGASHSADKIRSAIVSAEKRPGTHKGLAKATTRDGRLGISGLVRNEENLSVQLQAQDGTFYSSINPTSLNLGSILNSMSDSYGMKLSKSELINSWATCWLLWMRKTTDNSLRVK